MTIDKRSSGNYRIRHTENGKSYSITVPYKPTKKEAYELIRAKIDHTSNSSMTFEDAAQRYINAKKNVLSPSTIRGYTSFVRNLPPKLAKMDLQEIDNYSMQIIISDYAKDHKPKGVRNFWGFISAVLKLFLPEANISVTLPQKTRKEAYCPTVDDVTRLFEYAEGSEYYVALRLATMSLRLSEICALTLDDLNKDNELTINKAYVQSNEGYVIKEMPKTDASNRMEILPDDLADYIRKQGYIYKKSPKMTYYYLQTALKKLGIPQFGIHRLRHFFASYSHELGYSDAVIQSMGGWSTDHVMKSVYRHAMNKDEARRSIAADFSFSCLSQDKIGQDFSKKI